MRIRWLGVGALLVVAPLLLSTRSRPLTLGPRRLIRGQVRSPRLSLPYAVWLPPGYTPQRRWPALLFLHGFGERGEDGLSQTRGLGQFLSRNPERFPCLVVMPQLPRSRMRWEGDANELALRALSEAVQRFHGDPGRLYLVGCSMGGGGCWRLAAAHPERFAAVMPLCGHTEPGRQAPRLAGLPIWVFHGSADPVVPVRCSREMVQALRRAGNRRVRYTEYPLSGHNCWDQTFSDPSVLRWLMAQHQSPAAE